MVHRNWQIHPTQCLPDVCLCYFSLSTKYITLTVVNSSHAYKVKTLRQEGSVSEQMEGGQVLGQVSTGGVVGQVE